jgi:hypothetical protein
MDLRGLGWVDEEWIDLIHNRDQWKALMNTLMNLGFHKTLGLFLEWLHKRRPIEEDLAPWS